MSPFGDSLHGLFQALLNLEPAPSHLLVKGSKLLANLVAGPHGSVEALLRPAHSPGNRVRPARSLPCLLRRTASRHRRHHGWVLLANPLAQEGSDHGLLALQLLAQHLGVRLLHVTLGSFIFIMVIHGVRVPVIRIVVARRVDVVAQPRPSRPLMVIEVHGVSRISDGLLVMAPGTPPPGGAAHDLDEPIIILSRRPHSVRRARASSPSAATAASCRAASGGTRACRRCRCRSRTRNSRCAQRRRRGAGARHPVRGRWLRGAQTSRAPGELRPESTCAHGPCREGAPTSCGRPWALLAAVQASPPPSKIGIERARWARPIPFAGFRHWLAAIRRRSATASSPTICLCSPTSAAAAQRLQDALLLLGLMLKRLEDLAQLPRHGCGCTPVRAPATPIAAAKGPRRQATAAARSATSTTSTHRTLRRMVAGEQIRRGSHAEERSCRSSAAALAAMPGRLRRPLWRRRSSRTSWAGALSRGRAAQRGEVPQAGAAATSSAEERARAERDRRATAGAVTALSWASPTVVVGSANGTADRRPTPIAAKDARKGQTNPTPRERDQNTGNHKWF